MPIFILGFEIISEFVITNETQVILVFLKPKNYRNCRVTKRLDDLSITTLPIYADKEMKWSLTWFMGIFELWTSFFCFRQQICKMKRRNGSWRSAWMTRFVSGVFYMFTMTQGLFETRQFRHNLQEGRILSKHVLISKQLEPANKKDAFGTPCKTGCLLLS